MKKAALLSILVVVVPLAGGVIAQAQLTKVTVGYEATSAGHLPAWIAKESGIFRTNGLDVQLVYFRGGTPGTMALVSRQTPITQVSGLLIVNASLRGADTVMIGGGSVMAEFWLMTRPQIKTPEQLKGGSVAIATFGGQADNFARIALQRLGLTPVKDVAIVQIGGLADRLTALENGRVQSAIFNAPYNFMAQKRGYHNLLSVRVPTQGAGVATTRTFIRESPDIVRRYVKSQVEAIHRIKTDREMGLKVLAKYVGLQDKEILERVYDDVSSDDKLPPKQYPTLEGIKNILEPLAQTDAKAKAAKPEDFVDMSFIRELDQSGYIDSLYKKR
jgi:NitT/TauT family transport system substrate-binding protein